MKAHQTIASRQAILTVVAEIIIVVNLLGFGDNALAQGSWNWNGSSDGYWATGANWTQNNGGSTLPQGFVNFPSGPTRLTITNNYSAGTAGYQMWFNSGASSYTIWGNSLTMYDWGGAAPKIENDSTNLQTVNFPLVIYPASANPYVQFEPASGTLSFNSTVMVGNGDQLRVTSGNSHILTLNGVVSTGGGGGLHRAHGHQRRPAGGQLDGAGQRVATAARPVSILGHRCNQRSAAILPSRLAVADGQAHF